MNFFFRIYGAVFDPVERFGDIVVPTLARFLFAAILFFYYWNSGLTKLGGEGFPALLEPTFNAFAQIFPKGAEAAGYDITQATQFQKLVILAGTWSEFILPILILLGVLTRVAAIGMIGFVVVQSLTDLFGHGGWSDPKTLGAWFDGAPDGIILDQRMLWIFLLLVLVVRGAGPISVDGFVNRKRAEPEYI